jgi:hypothetical protein
MYKFRAFFHRLVKLYGIFAKGEERTFCKFNFWGKLHDLKEFFFRESCPYTAPAIEREKKP